MTVVFLPIPPPDTHKVEHLIIPFLEKQASRMGENVSEMARQIDAGEVHVGFAWDVENREALGMIGWRVIQQGYQRVGEILWLAGSDMDLWLPLMPEGIRFMKEHQRCDKIRAYSRKGWERVMSQFGFKQTAIILEREI